MGDLFIGERTYGGSHIQRRGVMNNVIVGKYCSIAEGLVIDGGFTHNVEFVSTYPFNSFDGIGEHVATCKGDIVIGNDVWIGEGVMIMGGVTIGHGSIIGARAIITKSIEPYSIVVGTDRFIRKRFTSEQIEKLLVIKWWDKCATDILRMAELLSSKNIDTFIEKYYEK